MSKCLNLKSDQKQSGVVLFIALIALVVMSLAAAALVRSVDTNTVIAGNLSFKQSAIVASDRGVETAVAWLNATVNNNANSLNTDIVSYGYLATLALDLENPAVLKSSNTWDNSAKAVGTGISSGVEQDTKNEIRYIVQRMCRNAAVPEASHCMFGSSKEPQNTLGGCGYTPCQQPPIINSPVYRVTVRVTGPKNTVSYTQTYVY